MNPFQPFRTLTPAFNSKEEYKSLENWLCVQRRAHCKGKLSQLRLDQMNDLEPLWLTPRDISMTQDQCFATHMESSRKTTRDVAKLSSAEKKRSPRTQNEPAAGGPKGQVPAASQERCDRLWTEMYKKLVTYKRKNNHIRVSVVRPPDVCQWCVRLKSDVLIVGFNSKLTAIF